MRADCISVAAFTGTLGNSTETFEVSLVSMQGFFKWRHNLHSLYRKFCASSCLRKCKAAHQLCLV